MSINRYALIRYRTIDKCLQNRFRKWTLEDLIEACSEALYEYEGNTKGISRRTVQLDIQNMRSEKLGYLAPIVVTDKKYYAYEDPNYSITNIPLSSQDLDTLEEAVKVLQQFKGLGHFAALGGVIQKLEDQIHHERTNAPAAIHFETNRKLKGLEHIEPIYHAITQQKALRIQYQGFKAQQAQEFVFHALLLKEFRNRWFVIGTTKKFDTITNLALDRIQKLELAPEVNYREMPDFDGDAFFGDIIGVTKHTGEEVQTVRLRFNAEHAPYVLTKPLHDSQLLDEELEGGGAIITLSVRLNFELERDILGYGEAVEVLEPVQLRRRIIKRVEKLGRLYHPKQGE